MDIQSNLLYNRYKFIYYRVEILVLSEPTDSTVNLPLFAQCSNKYSNNNKHGFRLEIINWSFYCCAIKLLELNKYIYDVNFYFCLFVFFFLFIYSVYTTDSQISDKRMPSPPPRIYVCMYVCMYIHVYTYIYTSVCMYACTCVRMYISTCIHIIDFLSYRASCQKHACSVSVVCWSGMSKIM